jgi:hypothetical protein
MRKLRATAFVLGLAFLPLTSPCQTAPAPPQGMQMCITGGGSGNVPGCPATSEPASVAGTVLGPAARDKLMREARLAYYNLHTRGLREFSCQVLPDWDAMYKNLKVDAAARDQVLPILKKVGFRVLVGPTGAASVSHQFNAAPPSEAIAERVRQSTGGIEQVVAGFFQTWSAFAFGSFFPEASPNLQVEEAGNKYRLRQKDASTDALVVMTKDLTIEHSNVESSKVSGSVDPVFAATKEGLLLTSYDSKVRIRDQAPEMFLKVKISYQRVGGYQLPSVVNAAVNLPRGQQVPLPLTFANCQVKGQ